MGRKQKYTQDIKTKACEEYLSGNKSAKQIANELSMGIHGQFQIFEWAKQYRANGPSIFAKSTSNNSYSKEFKQMVVKEYWLGSTIKELTVKYKIPSFETVRQWVLKYNRHEELKDYIPKPEVYIMSARKTTLEERIEIVNWCIDHDKNYKETATKFECSYTQVYQWVNKFLKNGENGLLDARGKRKSDEILSDAEKLNCRIKQLEKQNELLERENKLLKKLNALDWK